MDHIWSPKNESSVSQSLHWNYKKRTNVQIRQKKRKHSHQTLQIITEYVQIFQYSKNISERFHQTMSNIQKPA